MTEGALTGLGMKDHSIRDKGEMVKGSEGDGVMNVYKKGRVVLIEKHMVKHPAIYPSNSRSLEAGADPSCQGRLQPDHVAILLQSMVKQEQ